MTNTSMLVHFMEVAAFIFMVGLIASGQSARASPYNSRPYRIPPPMLSSPAFRTAFLRAQERPIEVPDVAALQEDTPHPTVARPSNWFFPGARPAALASDSVDPELTDSIDDDDDDIVVAQSGDSVKRVLLPPLAQHLRRLQLAAAAGNSAKQSDADYDPVRLSSKPNYSFFKMMG